MNLSEKNIPLIELQNTWQGEGPQTGRQMLLARFKKCSKNCPYCDTAVRMRTAVEGFYSIVDLNVALEKTRALMITGGEPTLKDYYSHVVNMLRDCSYEIANIETNGHDLIKLCKETQDIKKPINFIFSPKVFNAKDLDTELKRSAELLQDDRVYLKIVVDNDTPSNIFIEKISQLCPSRGKIYLMALGVTKEEITKNWDTCIELADRCKCNISSRLHIIHGFI